ncbi:PucR family transcriptional regulator, partial [Leucobacter sp. M11]|nr:PucR family transcriptional regulator [Leucobacter sp. M11]
MSAAFPRDSGIEQELRSALDLTNSLLAAVSQNDPVRALASRIAALSHGTCVIYDTQGRIIASSGEAPTQLIWNEIAATNVPNLSFEIGRFRVRTRTLGLFDGVHVLAVATREPSELPVPADLLLDTAERMLDAVSGIQHGATQRNRRDNEQLLAELQDGVLPSREHRYWSRLNQFHFSGYTPLRAFEAASEATEFDAEGHLQRIAGNARGNGVPLLVTLRRPDQNAPATVNGLIPSGPRSQVWLEQIAEDLLVGCSAPYEALSEIPDAFRQAE